MEETNQLAIEKHYSPDWIAERWDLGIDKTRELFKDEPGVIHIGHGESRFRRGYFSMKIPESVIHRVHARLQNNRVQ
jgi:hypothetical protein